MEEIQKRRNFKMQFILVIIYLLLTMSGLVLIKLGGNSGSLSITQGNVNFGVSLISLIGLICYIGSFLLYTRIVVIFDLSYITPLCTGIVQILTLIASKLIFKENVSIQGVIGVSIIIIGLIIMNLKRA